MKKSRSTNTVLLGLVEELLSKSRKEEVRIWRDLAERLSKASQIRAEVNISDIARHTKDKDVIAVPGKVLGAGAIDHKVTAAAVSFSVAARDKISSAGGKCLSLPELMKANPKGRNIKIMR